MFDSSSGALGVGEIRTGREDGADLRRTFHLFPDKQVDADGGEDGEGHPQYSAERGPLSQRRVFPEEKDVEQEPEHCGNGKNDEEDKQVKDAFDDRLELRKFHRGLVGHCRQTPLHGAAAGRTGKIYFPRYLYSIRRTV